jgi:hypothetical protein
MKTAAATVLFSVLATLSAAKPLRGVDPARA